MATMTPETNARIAADDDTPIPYMQRTRDYYLALGFNPYRWAHFVEVPFTPLADAPRPGAGRVDHDGGAVPAGRGRSGPGGGYNAAAKFYQVYSMPSDTRARSPDLARRLRPLHTTAEDINTYLPLAQMKEAAAAGRFGSLAPRLHGAPTNRSHRVTIETDTPELLRRCREDGVDAAVLVPS